MSLIAIDHLIWKRYLQRELTPHKVTLKQFYLLGDLARQGVLYPMDIAEMLFCDRPTASVVIRNLVKRGWVRREMDPDNAKHVQVRITPEGRDKLQGIQREREKHRRREDPLGCFSKSEISALEQLLWRLREHLTRVTGS